MKISKETVGVLKNFASINSNLMLKEGNYISSISVGKSLVGRARITETIPQDFGIYDVQEFLGVLSLFEDPEITFEDKYVIIKQGNSSIKYFAADESVLTYPKKFPPLGDSEIEFNLTANDITAILKTASVLKTSDVRFVGDGSSLSVVVGSKKTNTSNNFTQELGETDKTFCVSINTDNLKVIPQDFTASVINRRMIQLKSESLTYIIAIETDSSFE
jgi:hypothetical protein